MQCSLLSRLQEDLNLSFEGSENTERECHIENDSGKTWSNTTIESQKAISSQNTLGTIGKAVELVRIDTLHLCLDHVDWVVGVY